MRELTSCRGRLKSETSRTELITNVSHDIKTPLTSIINYADLITKEKTDNTKYSRICRGAWKAVAEIEASIEN